MEKLKPSMTNILLSLTVICLVAGAALSAANRYTQDAIAASKATELENAIKRVTPEFDNNPTAERYRVASAAGDSLTVYPAKKDGRTVGCAVESFDGNGFSGTVRVMVGFDAEGKIVNYSVLEHNETPGLGSKMQEWFATDKNRQSIIGRDMSKGALKVSKDGGDVDAITAATLSSRAFLRAVNLAFEASGGSGTDATSGATGAQKEEKTDAVSGATGTDINN
jgi:electron transport complex protein RnfG